MFKKLNSYFLLLLMVLSFAIVGCSDDDDDPSTPAKSESQLLLEYLESSTAGDYINTIGSNIVTASEVKTNITADPAKYLVIDIRDTAAFNKGHIKGAVNKTMKEILAYVKSINTTQYTKIYLICYSGQSAAYTTALLRMLGYNNIFSMKFGMCAWHSDFAASWKNGITNSWASDFVTPDVAKPAKGTTLPSISTGKSTGKEILEARVAELLQAAFPSIGQSSLKPNLASYFVMAYWNAADYAECGHVAGAPCYVPKSDLKSTTNLYTIPTNKPIAIYCYTGHTAAYAAAYLKVLGYDVKSISFGGNAMIYDIMLSKNKATWKDSEVMDYELEK